MNITVPDWLDPERVLPVYDSASPHVPKQFATCSMQPIHQERSEHETGGVQSRLNCEDGRTG